MIKFAMEDYDGSITEIWINPTYVSCLIDHGNNVNITTINDHYRVLGTIEDVVKALSNTIEITWPEEKKDDA